MGKIFGHVQQGSEYNNSHSQRGMHGYDSASDGVGCANDDFRSHFTVLFLLHALVIMEVLNGLPRPKQFDTDFYEACDGEHTPRHTRVIGS
jgi:hypothetical protein